MFNKFRENSGPYFFFVFRVIIGLTFMLHGYGKLFGGNFDLFTLMGVAGIIEFFGGILIALGLFTIPVAGIAGLQMLYVFTIIHGKTGWNPLENGGEKSLLFFAAFLVLFALGPVKWSLDNKIFGKR